MGWLGARWTETKQNDMNLGVCTEKLSVEESSVHSRKKGDISSLSGLRGPQG